jgi:hypothetical protein
MSIAFAMFETMWRLHPRGAASRGMSVDADGAVLGPECVLVQRTDAGYRVARRGAMRDLQRILLLDKDDPDWLYEQGQRIAEALDRGNVALAQIYGLRVPVKALDGRQLKRLAAMATLVKAGFNPDEPRIPAGPPGGGEWTTDGGPAADAASPGLFPDDGDRSSSSSPHLVGGRWPAPAGPGSNPLFQPAQAEEDENGKGGLLGDFMDLPRAFRQDVYEAVRARLSEIDPGNAALESLTGPDYSPTQADIDDLSEVLREAQERNSEPPATEWELGWGARGVALERQRLAGERTLPFNAPTIDDFPQGIALSIKSIDLNAP